jgi:hypothetical protein
MYVCSIQCLRGGLKESIISKLILQKEISEKIYKYSNIKFELGIKTNNLNMKFKDAIPNLHLMPQLC